MAVIDSRMIDEIVQNVLADLRGEKKSAPASRPEAKPAAPAAAPVAEAPDFAPSTGRILLPPASIDAPVASPLPPRPQPDAGTPAPQVSAREAALSMAVPVTPRPPAANPAPATPSKAPAGGAVDITDAVITAPLLAEKARGAKSVRFGVRSLVTPAAKDWLSTHRVEWSRIDAAAPAIASAAAGGNVTASIPKPMPANGRWVLGVVTVTGSVRSLMETFQRSSPVAKVELLGGGKEGVDYAVKAINLGEADGVILIVERAERIVCLANREDKIRAAAVYDRNHVQRVRTQMGPNLYCISPSSRSFIELRNIVQEIAANGKPQPPTDWEG